MCFSDSASLYSPLSRMKECVGNKRLTSLDMIGLIEGSGSAAMQHHFFVGLCSVRPFSKNPCFCTDIAMNYSCFYCVSINLQMSICEHSREKQSILNEGWIGAPPNKWAFGAPNAVLAGTVPAEQYAVCQKVLRTGAVPHRCQFFCPA